MTKEKLSPQLAHMILRQEINHAHQHAIESLNEILEEAIKQKNEDMIAKTRKLLNSFILSNEE